MLPSIVKDEHLNRMGNLVKRCRRKEDDPEIEERRLAISRTIASRIAATSSLPRRRRHLNAAIETLIAGKRLVGASFQIHVKFSNERTNESASLLKSKQ